MVGRKVILHNFDNAIAVVTFYQGDGKPLIAAILDEQGKRIPELKLGEWKDKKVLTSKYTFVK